MIRLTEIRPSLPRAKAKPGEVLTVGTAVVTGLTDNEKYPDPPADLPALKADLVMLQDATAAAVDGSKQVIAQRNNLQRSIAQKLMLLGHYVSITCNGDMAVFTSSGFQPLTVKRGPPQPLNQPSIRRIAHGQTGILLVFIMSVAAKSYVLRFGAIAAGVPGSWEEVAVPSVKSATPIDNLTPGTVYAFQVRALGTLGFTCWSDSVTFMCT